MSTSSFADSGKPNSRDKQINQHSANTKNKPTNEGVPVWVFDGDCIQLFWLEWANPQDTSCTLVNLIELNASNYIGTTRICPPAGQAYC
jgi:hypothetical protein